MSEDGKIDGRVADALGFDLDKPLCEHCGKEFHWKPDCPTWAAIKYWAARYKQEKEDYKKRSRTRRKGPDKVTRERTRYVR